MKYLTFLLLITLSSCGTFDAYRARTHLVDRTEPDILSCMGPPDKVQYVSPMQHILRWDYSQTGTDLDLEYGIYSFKLGRPGVCHVSMRMEAGITKSVHYEGVDVNPTDPDSICGRLVHDCLSHPETTPLPTDFNADRLLIGPKDIQKY